MSFNGFDGGHPVGRDVGGIVGTIRVGSISNSFALNPFVESTVSPWVTDMPNVGRIVGNIRHDAALGSPATLQNNYACANMNTNGGTPFPTPAEIYNVHNNRNGADIIGETAIVVGTVMGEAGERVRVPVTLQNSDPIAGFNLTLSFDSNLVSPAEISINSVLREAGSVLAYNINQNNDNTISVVWGSPVEENLNTRLFYIDFVIRDDIYFGANSEIISHVPITVVDMMTETRTDIIPREDNGRIIINDSENGMLWGDVNYNGVVDVADLVLLAQHLAGDPEADVCETGLILADVDRNERINIGDLILIAQYLADSDGSNGVVLGIPQ